MPLTIRTCKASLSGSLYTATVFTPSFLAVRITRQAISPRFAMSSFWNMIRLAAALTHQWKSENVYTPTQSCQHQYNHNHVHVHRMIWLPCQAFVMGYLLIEASTANHWCCEERWLRSFFDYGYWLKDILVHGKAVMSWMIAPEIMLFALLIKLKLSLSALSGHFWRTRS